MSSEYRQFIWPPRFLHVYQFSSMEDLWLQGRSCAVMFNSESRPTFHISITFRQRRGFRPWRDVRVGICTLRKSKRPHPQWMWPLGWSGV